MESEFIFRELTEKERIEIKKQAKGIMDSFAKKLELIDEAKLKEPVVERESFEREEGSVSCGGFNREIMFENAPNKNKDFILGEKKKW